MALIPFYKTETLWVIGENKGVPAGEFIRQIRNNVITVRTVDSLSVAYTSNSENGIIAQGLYSNFCNSSGVAYASLAAFKTATNDFFVNAPASLGASKWLTYKALLSQSGENAPIARVLNQDESDYIGDIVWTRDSSGSFTGNLTNPLDVDLTMYSPFRISSSSANNYDIAIMIAPDGKIKLYTLTGNGVYSDSILANLPIEIKVRKRGTAPILLSAETNTTGDKVILTFDKRINNYNLSLLIPNILQYLDGECQGGLTFESINNNIITCGLSTSTETGQVNTLTMFDISIESFNYGLLASFESFPVTNNVV